MMLRVRCCCERCCVSDVVCEMLCLGCCVSDVVCEMLL